MAKRAADEQLTKDGRNGDGFGSSRDMEEAPQRATAAQLANRKIKSLKKRPHTPNSPAGGAVNSAFSPQPSSFNPPPASTSFNSNPFNSNPTPTSNLFNNTLQSSAAPVFNFTGSSASSAPTSLFNGPSTTSSAPNPFESATTSALNFNSTATPSFSGFGSAAASSAPAFNFGGPVSSAGTFAFGASTDKPITFGAPADKPPAFGASSNQPFAFGASAAAQPPASKEQSNIFAASAANPPPASSAPIFNFGTPTPPPSFPPLNPPANPFQFSSGLSQPSAEAEAPKPQESFNSFQSAQSTQSTTSFGSTSSFEGAKPAESSKPVEPETTTPTKPLYQPPEPSESPPHIEEPEPANNPFAILKTPPKAATPKAAPTFTPTPAPKFTPTPAPKSTSATMSKSTTSVLDSTEERSTAVTTPTRWHTDIDSEAHYRWMNAVDDRLGAEKEEQASSGLAPRGWPEGQVYKEPKFTELPAEILAQVQDESSIDKPPIHWTSRKVIRYYYESKRSRLNKSFWANVRSVDMEIHMNTYVNMIPAIHTYLLILKELEDEYAERLAKNGDSCRPSSCWTANEILRGDSTSPSHLSSTTGHASSNQPSSSHAPDSSNVPQQDSYMSTHASSDKNKRRLDDEDDDESTPAKRTKSSSSDVNAHSKPSTANHIGEKASSSASKLESFLNAATPSFKASAPANATPFSGFKSTAPENSAASGVNASAPANSTLFSGFKPSAPAENTAAADKTPFSGFKVDASANNTLFSGFKPNAAADSTPSSGFKPTIAAESTPSGFTPKVSTTSGPPKFGGVAGGSFLTQFGQKAQKVAEKAQRERMEEDIDSDEDEETWIAKDNARQEEKRRKFEEERARVQPPPKFLAVDKLSPQSVDSIDLSRDTSRSGSVFDAPRSGQAELHPGNPFAHLSAASTPQDNDELSDSDHDEDDADEEDNTPATNGETKTVNPFFTASSSKAPTSFMANASSGTSFGGSIFSSAGNGSIFNSTFPSNSSETQAKPPSFKFTPASNEAGDTNSLFKFSSAASGSTGDNISPFKANAPSGNGAGETASPFKFTPLAKPAPSSFGTPSGNPAKGGSIFNFPAAKAPISGASTPTFSFGAPKTLDPPSLPVSDVSGAETTADEGEGSEAATDEPAKDLVGFEAAKEGHDVLYEAARVKVFQFGSEPLTDQNKDQSDADRKKWIVKGVGPIAILRNQSTSVVSILMKSEPAGRVVINTRVLKDVQYKLLQKRVQFLAPKADGADSFLVQFKEPADAGKFAEVATANK